MKFPRFCAALLAILIPAPVFALGIVVGDYSGTYFLTPEPDGTFRSTPIGPQTNQFGSLEQQQSTSGGATAGAGAPGVAAPYAIPPPYAMQQQQPAQVVCPAPTCPPPVCNCVCPNPEAEPSETPQALPTG